MELDVYLYLHMSVLLVPVLAIVTNRQTASGEGKAKETLHANLKFGSQMSERTINHIDRIRRISCLVSRHIL